jgi:hypothetical protein
VSGLRGVRREGRPCAGAAEVAVAVGVVVAVVVVVVVAGVMVVVGVVVGVGVEQPRYLAVRVKQ